MSDLHVKYLLVGGGLAAATAARAIRGIDREGVVLMVGQEIARPYHRPPLSKEYLRRQAKRDAVFVHEPSWFGENDVQLRTGRRVVALDATRNSVTLDSGEGISFDKLLLAVGGMPAHLDVPGADMPNVFYLRTLEDAERLHHAIDKARAEGQKQDDATGARGRACVIGGGVLGVEVAASLRQAGLGVDLIVSGARPWHKFAGEVTGQFLARALESRGVSVHLDQRPQRLEGDGRVQRVVTTATQTIPCDFVVAAIGMVINRELLRGTPLAAETAVLVDEHCRTSHPDIYAAGDCAAVFDPLFGKHRLLDHWDNAQVTGRIAGENMAGRRSTYDAVNYFFSDVFDVALEAWGEPRRVNHRLIRGQMNGDADFLEIGVASDGRVVQVLSINHKADRDVLPELIRRRVNVSGREEQVKDPTVPLGDLLSG